MEGASKQNETIEPEYKEYYEDPLSEDYHRETNAAAIKAVKTKQSLKAVALAMWDLYKKKCENSTGSALEGLKGFYRHAYKGAGENSAARYWMIKMLFDKFQRDNGEYAVLHVSVTHTDMPWGAKHERRGAYDQAKRLKWTNEHLFAKRGVGFMFVNETHVVCFRLDKDNNVVIRETQAEEFGDIFKDCLYDSGIFGNKLLFYDEETPQQTKGSCTAMAMCSAMLPDHVYPTEDDINSLKLKYFREILLDLVESGASPMDQASDEWKHFRIGLFDPYAWDRHKPWQDETYVEFCEDEEMQKLHQQYIEDVTRAEELRRRASRFEPVPAFVGDDLQGEDYEAWSAAIDVEREQNDDIYIELQNQMKKWRERLKTKGGDDGGDSGDEDLEYWLREQDKSPAKRGVL
jgi:hypothetical protein